MGDPSLKMREKTKHDFWRLTEYDETSDIRILVHYENSYKIYRFNKSFCSLCDDSSKFKIKSINTLNKYQGPLVLCDMAYEDDKSVFVLNDFFYDLKGEMHPIKKIEWDQEFEVHIQSAFEHLVKAVKFDEIGIIRTTEFKEEIQKEVQFLFTLVFVNCFDHIEKHTYYLNSEEWCKGADI